MANWICNDCGMAFDEPQKYHECVGEFWGTPAWECFGRCPFCASENFNEAIDCEMCGEPSSELYTENGLCEGCRHEIEEKFIAWLDSNGDEARVSVLATICDICSDLYAKAVNADE